MKSKQVTQCIDKRIENLFGNIGGEEGQYYFDSYYCAVVQVTNNAGGVQIILQTSTPSKLLDILNGIETYLYHKGKKGI